MPLPTMYAPPPVNRMTEACENITFANFVKYNKTSCLFYTTYVCVRILTDERVGNLTFVVDSADKVAKVRSQLTMIVRTTWSNSPNHGCRIVATVLNNPQLKSEW